MKRHIAVFDFDGTLTTHDTFPAFIKYACGTSRYVMGFMLYSPLLILMKLRLYPNWKAKQLVFSYFFQGWDYQHFKLIGEQFAKKIAYIINDEIILKLEEHLSRGDKVLIITASIREWVQPWCMTMNVNGVIATEVEVDSTGRLTGRFKSKNCYGKEKVRRLLDIEPQRDSYRLYAYGDSRGDKEIFAFADVVYKI